MTNDIRRLRAKLALFDQEGFYQVAMELLKEMGEIMDAPELAESFYKRVVNSQKNKYEDQLSSHLQEQENGLLKQGSFGF